VKTVKGFGMGQAGESEMVAHNVKKMDLDSLKVFRDRFHVPLEDDELAELPFIRPPADSPEERFVRKQRQALGGPVPWRPAESDALAAPPLSTLESLLQDSEDREFSTTMAFVRLLGTLTKDQEIGKHIVPIIPDEARTFGMEGLFRQLGIYAPAGQLYEPQDAEAVAWYREDPEGQILEEGITEAGAVSSWIAAGTAHVNYGVPMIPFYAFYSMFGFQRVGDLLWAAGDSRARGFLLGATSGRTTLNGEGLQHQDGQGLLFASAFPTCRAYDPTFAYEVAVLVQKGIERMYAQGEDIFYYITLLNENYAHPALPEGVEEGIADLLREDFDVQADVWSVLGINQLHRDGMRVEEWNRLHPDQPPRMSWAEKSLRGHEGPVVVSTDYVRAYPEQIRRLIDRPLTVLGTDGFGRSDFRSVLRDFFKVDRYHVVVAALKALADEKKLAVSKVAEAIRKYQLDAEAPPSVDR
jgi:pyruvate dehydrogenase E1 component